MRPILVGEDNPYSRDPRYALYPAPEGSAGHRLCFEILGLSRVTDYIRAFDRANLCSGRWSIREARETARGLARGSHADGVWLILLGAKVASAFGLPHAPFAWDKSAPYDRRPGDLEWPTIRVVQLPHPSGRSRAWNEPGAAARAREVLRGAGILPLPPWPPAALPVKATGDLLEDLPSTDTSVERPAWCSNCHAIVRGDHCPECGPP